MRGFRYKLWGHGGEYYVTGLFTDSGVQRSEAEELASYLKDDGEWVNRSRRMRVTRTRGRKRK